MPRKRQNGDGSIFRRGNKWLAVISLGRDRNGRRIRRTKTADTREGARMMLAQLQAEAAVFRSAQRMTVADLLQTWLKTEVQPNKAEGTEYSYRFAAETHIAPFLGTIQVDALKPMHVQQWLSRMREEAVGSRTQQNAFTVLSIAMTFAVRMGVTASNPCDAVAKPGSSRKDIRPFSPGETLRILDFTRENRIHGLFVLALSIGMRQGELFGLQWEDIEDGKLTIKRQASEVAGTVVFRQPKTKSGRRTIMLPDQCVEGLHHRRKMALAEGHAKSHLVFPGEKGGVMRRSNFGNRIWKPILKKLGIPHRGFHHARHTAITSMLSVPGINPRDVAAIVGHSRIGYLLDTYAHWLPDDAERVAGLLNKFRG